MFVRERFVRVPIIRLVGRAETWSHRSLKGGLSAVR